MGMLNDDEHKGFEGNPKINNDDPLYQMLRNEQIKDFNEARKSRNELSFKGYDFRNVDLRGANLSGVDLTDAYFRNANMRGLDLRGCVMEGASIHEAKISGCYFPSNVSADELMMSLQHGTRIRVSRE